MRFARFKSLILTLPLLLTAACSVRAEEAPWTDQFLNEFTQIKARLTAIEQAQDALSKREDETLKEIDQVRTWATNSPGRKGKKK